jgi:hypothetical protein
MRRWISVVAAAAGLLSAMAVGPMGTAAAPPFVLACTPAKFATNPAYQISLSIYNPSASLAYLTTKVLAGNGTIVNNSAPYFPPVSGVIDEATKTLTWTFGVPVGLPDPGDGTVPSSIRIVSNVRVAATLSHDVVVANGTDPTPWIPVPCDLVQP